MCLGDDFVLESRNGHALAIHHRAKTVFGDVPSLDGFESFTTPSVTLEAGVARVQASIDGEVVTLSNPLAFRIRPRALRVIVP